jgi:hypothetical protein
MEPGESVETRLERLERQNTQLARQVRWSQRLLAVLMLAGVVAFIGGAMQGPQHLDVTSLSVVGPNGKDRIALGVGGGDGAARIDLFDSGGDMHVLLFTDAQGASSGLKMRDIKDNVRIDFGITPTGDPTLLFDGQPH